MISEKTVRLTLWLSVPFNFVAAYAVAFPAQFPGTFFEIPLGAPPLYAFMLGGFILLFGLAYGWAAQQGPINKTIVVLGIFGKYGVFVVAGLTLLAGMAPVGPFIITIADATFATIWLLWLLKN